MDSFLDFADVSWYLTFSFLINKCHRLHRPHFEKLLQSSTKENKNWKPYTASIIFQLVLLLQCYNFCPYVQTLPLWTGGSRFEKTPPVLPFFTEIPRFEMILACMSDIYEFLSFYKVYHTFYKLNVKILTVINEIKSVRCS